jgi:enoyl-CoA hydratase/carnithine racemase
MKKIINDELLYSVKDGVATITVNRAEKLNALNFALIEDIAELLSQIDRDPAVRVVVLDGAGDKAFVAGADVSEFYEMNSGVEFHKYLDTMINKINLGIRRLSKPVIAAVDGYAFGGGLALVLASDMAFATRKSKFGAQEINMGIIGNNAALALLVGQQKASEITMLGKSFNAEEAWRMLVVNRIAEDRAELDVIVGETAATLLVKSPDALYYAKRVITLTLDSGMTSGMGLEIDGGTTCYDTAACKEAMAPFAKKD